jgi:hypothetical protein
MSKGGTEVIPTSPSNAVGPIRKVPALPPNIARAIGAIVSISALGWLATVPIPCYKVI